MFVPVPKVDAPIGESAMKKELAELTRQYREKGWTAVETGNSIGFRRIDKEEQKQMGAPKTSCRTCEHFKQGRHEYRGPKYYSDCEFKKLATHANCAACSDYKPRSECPR